MLDFEGFPYPFERIQFGENLSSMPKGKPAGESRRWRCLCSYDGTDFAGWQKQSNGLAVQDRIEHALGEIFGQVIRTVGAGRTDAGVHADGQVFHFDGPWQHSCTSMLQAIRSKLPAGISPLEIIPAKPNFHALSSAKGKRYRYRAIRGWAKPRDERFAHSLKNRRIDCEKINQAVGFFIGEHDFTAFSANRGAVEQSRVRKVWKVKLTEKNELIEFVVEGEGFLYKMVRSMVGALLDVGSGKMEPSEIEQILQSCIRTERVVSAPAKGLSLEKVFYRKPRVV
jgi:tRNA pseudouridine38-40 synthase